MSHCIGGQSGERKFDVMSESYFVAFCYSSIGRHTGFVNIGVNLELKQV